MSEEKYDAHIKAWLLYPYADPIHLESNCDGYCPDLEIELRLERLEDSYHDRLWRNYDSDGSFDLVVEEDCNNPYPPLNRYCECDDYTSCGSCE